MVFTVLPLGNCNIAQDWPSEWTSIHDNSREMYVNETIHYYHQLGMPAQEISDTLGLSVYTVYRNLRHTSPGKRKIHTFPNLDTSLDQLNKAEHNRDYVSRHIHPSKED